MASMMRLSHALPHFSFTRLADTPPLSSDLMSTTFSAIRPPHILTTELFQMYSHQYQYQGFGGMPRATDYSTSVIVPAQERMALPPLNVLPSRKMFAFSGHSHNVVVASPAATLTHQPGQSPSKKRVRALPNASKCITLDMLRPHFEKPLAEAASIFGICMTLMKKICRKNGVPRWPHRQIRGLRKSIWSIEKALRCCEYEAQRLSYSNHLQKQRAKLITILKGPTCSRSKAAFELVLSELCSPMSDLDTPTAAETVRDVQTSPMATYSAPSPVFLMTPNSQSPQSLYLVQRPDTNTKSPRLPSIASLLIKNEEQRIF